MIPAMRSFLSRDTIEMPPDISSSICLSMSFSLATSAEEVSCRSRIPQRYFFANQRGGLRREFLGKFRLQDGFVGGG